MRRRTGRCVVMDIAQVLAGCFYVAIGLCGIGLLDKVVRLMMVSWPRHSQGATELVDAPLPPSFWTIGKKLLLGPSVNFHYRTSRVWTLGCAFYHIAIILTVAGYVVSTAIMLGSIASGVPIPDFHGQMQGETSPAISNILEKNFGNAEPFPSQFLFGSFAPYFQAIAWIDLPLAVIGNGCLLYAILRQRADNVRYHLVDGLNALRLEGRFFGQRLGVRLLILSIILTEFIGRTGWIPDIAYYHAVLALILVAALPYTYLSHILLIPLVAWSAIRRHRRNAIA